MAFIRQTRALAGARFSVTNKYCMNDWPQPFRGVGPGTVSRRDFLAKVAGNEVYREAFRSKLSPYDFSAGDLNKDGKIDSRAEWSALYDAIGGARMVRCLPRIQEMMHKPAVLL